MKKDTLNKKNYGIKKYVSEVFGKYSVISVLLIALSLYFAACLFDGYDILGREHAISTVNYAFITVCLGILFLSVAGTVIFFMGRRNVMFIDMLLLSLILFTVATVTDTIITHGNDSRYTFMYIIYCALFLLSVASVCIRVKILTKQGPESQIVYTFNNSKTYYLTLLRKFSFILPVIIAVTFAIAIYLYIEGDVHALVHDFLNTHAGTHDVAVLTAAVVIIALIFLLYACVDCTKKRLCTFDLILFSLVISVPLILFEMFIFGFTEKFVTAWIGLVLFCVFFTVMRIKNIDLLYEDRFKNRLPDVKNLKPYKKYYGQIFARRSLFLALNVSALLCGLILIAEFSDFINSALSVTSGYIYYASMGALAVIALIMLITMVFIVICCKCKRVLFTDYLLFIIAVTDILSLAALYYKTETWTIVLFAFIAVFSLATTLTRIRYVGGTD